MRDDDARALLLALLYSAGFTVLRDVTGWKEEDAKENDGDEVCRENTARESKKEKGGTDNSKCASERRRMVEY
uniref:Uncharacterized protein n=1 Tax=Timema bartmani TaxID=61472 RepID=A0A7R9F765_9NEOP|nr:unnamed protein product [Timema bartmani]